jgi:hypothetical protein
LTGVEADLTPRVRNIDPIAHQSAALSALRPGLRRIGGDCSRDRRPAKWG